MDARRRALAVDFALALAAMGLGVFATPSLSLGVAILVAIGTTVCVGGLYFAEQTDALALIDEQRPRSLVIVAAVTFGVALALILGRLAVPWPSGPLLLGMGAGLAGYRAVYGVWHPVPARRLTQARGGWRRRDGPF